MLTTPAYSEDLITLGNDTSGFLTAAKLLTNNTVLESNSSLGLDVTSAQRASTLASATEINTAATSYGSLTLTSLAAAPSSTASPR